MVKHTHQAFFQVLEREARVPPRPPQPTQPPSGGRRIRVAILDTGLAEHDWFQDEVTRDATRGAAAAAGHGSDFRRHGTFVAGVVRQEAPDAHLLSIELAQTPDGKVEDGEIASGLELLLSDWLNTESFVDVVCLAVGYRRGPDGDDDPHHTAKIEGFCRELGKRGVLLVAAAGNRLDGSDHGCVHPAALAKPATEFPIVAVGATDESGKWADFSARTCVSRRWRGTDVVSAFPVVTIELDKARQDEYGSVWVDPDSDLDVVQETPVVTDTLDFTDGYARGSGTSFAAAGFAGRVARAMYEDAERSSPEDDDADAARERVRRAMEVAGGLVPPEAR
jgi:serine protease